MESKIYIIGKDINKIEIKDFAEVAQSVEQGTENPRVGSSILSLGTRFNQLKGALS